MHNNIDFVTNNRNAPLENIDESLTATPETTYYNKT